MGRDERYDSDVTPSWVIVEQYRNALEVGEEASLALVHYRGGKSEFDLGAEYTRSNDPLDRVVGADILSQLGWSARRFLDESVALLIKLLRDSDSKVVAHACRALGHRADPRAIVELARLADDCRAEIRQAVACGLFGHTDLRAIQVLIQLAHDSDASVRNWATFGIGSQVDVDTPEIRAALAANLNDPDHEIRGEALCGLARRKDVRVVDLLLSEWHRNDVVSRLSIEAATEIADTRLYAYLTCLKSELQLERDADFAVALDKAIVACKTGRRNLTGRMEKEADGHGLR